MSTSPFPYTCELCGAEGLTDEGMRSHTMEAHVAGRPSCPFCDCCVPQPQYDEDSKMTTTDSCSYNTPGSMNGWHSPESSASLHNGAISKTYQNGYQDKEYSEERSPKNINLTNGLKNINISNGVIPKKLSREGSREREMVNGHDKKHSSPSHNSRSYEGSPNKNKLTMASAGQGSPLRSQLALKLKPNTPKKSAPTPSPTVQCLLCDFTSTCPRKLEEHINRAHFDLTSPSVLGNANSNNVNPTLTLGNPTLTLDNPTLDNPTLNLDNPTLAYSAMALSPGPHSSTYQCPICEREFTNGSEVEVHVNVEHRDILSPQKSAQYGMEEDEEGYTNRASNSLKRAVYSGALSVAGDPGADSAAKRTEP
ncbi:hypothetical protein MSG28_013016 [Choristoneura fumiferana]|uniref:Uncharacterized protein n=1 Tax=Choristoneura fumiferana TaxID=7141 RepID=A0ACC0KS05_CHOFU|nr:hypothetical protein MSG28_013016 [Choristoneura fumiferana]